MEYKLYLGGGIELCKITSKQKLDFGSTFVLDSQIYQVRQVDGDRYFVMVVADNLIAVQLKEWSE